MTGSVGQFDVLVVGGGHAGAEAAWAAANLGARTCMVTFRRDAIGRMSCNPAIGGIGKGQMVREIDALGGLMGRVADETGIQFRMLNRRKGPAVQAPRCQSDREHYATRLREYLENCPNLTILEAGVERILADELPGRVAGKPRCKVRGVLLHDGRTVRAEAVIVTSGTFLRALMHCGERKQPGGRVGEAAAVGLSASLEALGLGLGRLKTGTPPRLARDSIDFDRTEPQPGDADPVPFSFLHDSIDREQVCCWITYTNEQVHEIIRANLHRAPMYSGQIRSRGPRYCPSIEDKVVRFADKSRHQVFLEPEGYDSDRIYANGISTSLPTDVQERIVRLIPGLEQARIVQWGYAVEYDFVPPEQIDATLAVKHVEGLYLAGQINGTSGYEEAAGQGIVAGINAARFVAGREPVVLRRDQAYIGVMIDDLVTRGVTEPYRMFTSRAEHRLHLRHDNADERLTPLGRELGLVCDERWRRFEHKQRDINALRQIVHNLRHEGRTIADWLRRPDEDGERFLQLPQIRDLAPRRDVWERVRVEIRYDGYIQRQQRAIQEFRRMEDEPIPADFDYRSVPHLRAEARERWEQVRPRSVGQAARVSGICPTDVSLLMVVLSKLRRERGLQPSTGTG